jgi:hypothetical protein
VKQAWQIANGNFPKKLATTLQSLHRWGQNQFGIIPKRIKETQIELQKLNQQSNHNHIMQQIRTKEQELDNLLESEELWWSQRSRVLWLQHGDKNTKFFHQKASHRRQRNKIEVIKDKQGNLQYDYDNIERTLVEHFQELFTSQTTHNIDRVAAVVKGRIKEEEMEHLNAKFTKEEVVSAISEMKGHAAPGPDGLPAIFFHNYWAMPAEKAYVNQLMFFKNIAIAGGLLAIAALGAGRFSVDRK